jgi:2-aminobenzoate-CoA ligase
MSTAHIDTFARDHLPPADQQPEFLFELPELQFPAQLNCAAELLDRPIAQGRGDRTCIRAPGLAWTWRDLQDRADRIAHVLVQDMGVVPGNRVLLRAPNNPMLAACWFAVMKAGAIAVATMPLLRAKELKAIIDIGRISHALCDAALADELQQASSSLELRLFNTSGGGSITTRRSSTSIPRPTTPASSPSRRAPPACPRRRCISTAM